MNICGLILAFIAITSDGIMASSIAAKDLRPELSEESNLTRLETTAGGVAMTEAASFVAQDLDAGKDAAGLTQVENVTDYRVAESNKSVEGVVEDYVVYSTGSSEFDQRLTSAAHVLDVLAVENGTGTSRPHTEAAGVYLPQDVAEDVADDASNTTVSTSGPAFNDSLSHFWSAKDLEWTIDQYSAKANLSVNDSFPSFFGTSTVRSLVDQTQRPRVDKKTLGAKWAACFDAVNVTKPAINFTCNTFLLMHYSFMQFWTKHSAVQMCEHREAYGELMECVLDASKGCLPPANLRHVPDNGKARIGLNYICDVGMAERFKVNITCAQSHFREVFECIYRDVQLVTGRDSLPVPIWPSLMCRTYDIADLCSWENLQVCGRQTAAAYTRLMSLYLRPPSCSSSASRPEGRQSAALFVSVALVVIRGLSWAYSYR